LATSIYGRSVGLAVALRVLLPSHFTCSSHLPLAFISGVLAGPLIWGRIILCGADPRVSKPFFAGICLIDPYNGGDAQVCPDCNSFNGLSCPASSPTCCAKGMCVPTLSDCTQLCYFHGMCPAGWSCSIDVFIFTGVEGAASQCGSLPWVCTCACLQ